ncbi:hypothetical protein HCU64_14195 [Methylobacterium sp. C25]|uniref:hypothetical protein n=1 Tax=Methylobacterium sp. C25 TaxID=2721622 RepID=UPI001F456C4D|nr:hypothetical protein [Methylobacterium sp. C25]MCE4224910.1 hypothetical protein [Methylobacterium sp. C25]
MKETLGRIMATAAYRKAPDGDAKTKGTKAAMLTGTVAKYREAAGRYRMADPNVRQAVYQQAVKARPALAAKDGLKSDKQVGPATIEQLSKAYGLDLAR